jgi:hypothetical protein
MTACVALVGFMGEAGATNVQKPCSCKAGQAKPAQKRYPLLFQALQLMELKKSQVIVETGMLKKGTDFKANCSTSIFAKWAQVHNGKVFSINKDRSIPDPISKLLARLDKNPRDDTHEQINPPDIQFFKVDTIEFLKTFDQPIDVLYLDDHDFDPKNPYPCQHYHLEEVMAAESKMSQNGIIIIGKCNPPQADRAKLVIDHLLLRDWKLFLKGSEVILYRD